MLKQRKVINGITIRVLLFIMAIDFPQHSIYHGNEDMI